MIHVLFFTGETRGSDRDSWILYAIVWMLGIVWHFIWKRRGKAVGVGVTTTYGELPLE